MLDIGIIVLTVALIIALLFVGFVLSKKGKDNSVDANAMLQSQIAELVKSNQELKESITDNINKKLSEGQELVQKNMNTQFDRTLKTIESFNKEVGKMAEEASKISLIGEQINKLQSALQNSKQKGAIGEYFLETTIKNVLPPDVYKFQYKFKDGLIADAVLFLDDKLLAVDSKFSIENYTQYLEETDIERKSQLEKKFTQDLKLRIMETTKYIKQSEGTLDFAFMFIPSESIYYDLLTYKVGKEGSRSLLEYAFVDKKVIIVSPTTFYAYLQTVLQGLRSLSIERQAEEIKKDINTLNKHLHTYGDVNTALGKSLQASVNHYNKSTKQFNLISKDTVKIDSKNKLLSIDQVEEQVDIS